MRPCEVNYKSMSFHIALVQLYIEAGNDFNVLIFTASQLYLCSCKSFLNFRLSSTRLLMKRFLKVIGTMKREQRTKTLIG